MTSPSAGRAGIRRPALALLVGLALALVAHVAACAVHAPDLDPRAAGASVTADAHVVDTGAPPSHHCAGHAASGDHDDTCCAPAEPPGDIRTSASAPLLPLLLLGLLPLWSRDAALPSSVSALRRVRGPAPVGSGLNRLRLVCVSRT